jgi:C4-dicarboxylate-specific signal transduction histidine kinase
MHILTRNNSKSIAVSERAIFGNYLTLLKQSDMDRLRASAATSTREDPNFFGQSKTLGTRLPPAVDALTQQIAGVESYLEGLSNGTITKMETDHAYLLLSAAIQGTGVFWDIAAAELRMLMENRIEQQTQDRTKALYFTTIAWLMSLITVLFVGRAILSKQKKLAEKINEQGATIASTAKFSALGEMAGGIAHEINNPLAAIKSLSDQLQEVVDDDPLDKALIKKMAANIEKTADRITKIILGLRSFSRDGSKDPFNSVNVHQLIEETLSFCNQRFKNCGTNLIIEEFKTDLSFEGRATEISQVLLNLLINANDAIIDRQQKWIKISVYEQPEWVQIRVTDCGEGISPEIHNKIFQPFFTTKEIGKGTGLGLSISVGIVQSHQGELKIDQQCPNTCFVIQLPKRQIKTSFVSAA